MSERKVSKQEYLEFVANYPSELHMREHPALALPMRTQNDPNLGNWPRSIVAYETIVESGEPDYVIMCEACDKCAQRL